MQEIDLTIFADLKTLLIVLVAAWVVLTVFVLSMRMICKEPFRAGKYTGCNKYNLMLVSALYLMMLILLVFACVDLARLKKVMGQVGEDFVRFNPALKADEFYYGTSELRDDFEMLRRVCETNQQVIQAELQSLPLTAPIADEFLAQAPHGSSKRLDKFLLRNWPEIQNHMRVELAETQAIFASDVQECDRAIERINYFEKRFVGSVNTLQSKAMGLFVGVAVVTAFAFVFLGFCARGLFKNRAPKAGKTNWGLAKRLYGLSTLTLVIVLFVFIVCIVTTSVNNALWATADAFKDPMPSGMKALNLTATEAPRTSHAEQLTLFNHILGRLEARESVVGRTILTSMAPWHRARALNSQRDELIRKIDSGLERAKFGPVFRVQQQRLYDVLWGLNKTFYFTFFWLGVFGFGYLFVTLFSIA